MPVWYKLLEDHTVVPMEEPVDYSDSYFALQWDIANRRVAETTLPNGTWVSTVFLCTNLAYPPDSTPPLFFETMVFPKKGSGLEEDQARYSTWDEAVAGHKTMVTKYSSQSDVLI